MVINARKLLVNLAVSLGTGIVSGIITYNSMELYRNIEKPPLSPPAVLFPVVWTVLFFLMGVSAYIIGMSNEPENKKRNAMTVYYVQLALNFLWSVIFFRFGAYADAFVCLVLLWISILIMIILFNRISKKAWYLQIPYLLWVTFAGYLNLAIAIHQSGM